MFDPFRNAHGCDENSSGEMAGILEQLVYMKSRDAAVIFLHHVAKTEGSSSRGSSAIDGAVDVALLQTMDSESGLIELKTVKNRFGEGYRICIRPDFDKGTFEVTDSPEFTKRTVDSEKLRQVNSEVPGLSQNAIWKKSGMMKARFVALLKQGNGTFWREEKEGSSLRYYPLVLKTQNNPENNRTGQGVRGCSPVLSPLGENREQPLLDPSSCSRTGAGNRTARLCSLVLTAAVSPFTAMRPAGRRARPARTYEKTAGRFQKTSWLCTRRPL